MTLFDNFLVDSAHNEDSVRNLINYLDTNFNGKKINLFFACSENKDPEKLLEPFEGIVDKIIFSNEDQKKQYQSGNSKVLGWFVGQVMKETKGQANPSVVNKVIIDKLKK